MKQVYSSVKKVSVCLALSVAFGLQAFNVLADSWSNSPGNTSFIRQGATAYTNTTTGNAFVVTGSNGVSGVTGGTTTNRRFAPPSSWNTSVAFGGGARTSAVSFFVGGNGYVGTGVDNSSNNLSDLWQFNGTTWTQMASLPGSARRNAVGFSIGSKGYIGTGWDGTTNFNDFYEYDATGNSWSAKASFPGSARHGAVGWSIGSQGYIGTGQDASALNNDFYQYDQASNTWTAKASFPGSARVNAAGFSMVIKGYIGTGFDGTRKVDFYEYDAAANTWAAKANFIGNARERAVGFSIGATGYLGTGTDFTTVYQDVYAYSADPFIHEYSLSSSSYVAGSQINVNYATNLANGSTLTAQLSNASGSFASPVTLGTLNISSASGTIAGTIPSNQAVGTGYRVRIVSGATTSNDNGTNISIISPAHVTMSLQNPSQPNGSTIQFDLMVVSDGDAASDLRANAFQYGIDYNPGILPSGATVAVSMVGGTSDFASITTYSYPAPGVTGTLRIVGSPCSGCNSVATQLTVGHVYRVGRFQVSSSANFVACSSANFALVDAPSAGKTTTASILYVGADASSTSSFDQTGTGNFQRSIGTVSNISLNCITNVNVKLFIEGYYTSGGQMRPVMQNEAVGGATSSQCDTVTIELHSTSNPSTVVESHKGVVGVTGNVYAAFSPSITGQTLWLAVKHREAIQTWSSSPISFSGNNNYDFTTSASQAYGSNQVQVDNSPTAFAFYCGDVTQDENVDLLDFSPWDAQTILSMPAYLNGDLNGDGNVDLIDFPYLDNNLITGRYSHHP